MKMLLVQHKYSIPLSDPCIFPLGFMQISSQLKMLGHNVKILNYNLWKYDYSQELYNFKPDYVFFSGFEEFNELNIEYATMAKQLGIITVLGGAMATFGSDNMMPFFDIMVLGEGENVLNKISESRGKIQGTKVDLDVLPLVDYNGFGVEEYHKRNGIKHMGVLTSRGCPWSCKFCAQTCHFQFRDLDNVFEEIDLYREKYKIDLLVFCDNTLNVSKNRFRRICKEMGIRRLPWSASIRLDRLDEEMVLDAKRGGCKYFVVGVESFKQKKLDLMNKNIRVDQICKSLDLLEKHKINYHGNVLMGLPGETAQDILEECDSIPSGYNIFPVLVQPFIGTCFKNRSITAQEETLLSAMFSEDIKTRGMVQYPELKKAA